MGFQIIDERGVPWFAEERRRSRRDENAQDEDPIFTLPLVRCGVRVRSGREMSRLVLATIARLPASGAMERISAASEQQQPQVIGLDFERCGLLDDDVDLLVCAMQAVGPRLQYLYLAGNGFSARAADRIVTCAVTACPRLGHVGMTANPLGPAGLLHLTRLVQALPLQRLHATRIAWEPERGGPGVLDVATWRAFNAAVAGSPTLCEVFFKGNGPVPEGLDPSSRLQL